MTLVENWRHIAAKSWSSRLAWLAAFLSGVEVLLPYVQMLIPPEQIPQGRFAMAALLVSAGAGIARLVAQPSLHTEAANGNDSKSA